MLLIFLMELVSRFFPGFFLIVVSRISCNEPPEIFLRVLHGISTVDCPVGVPFGISLIVALELLTANFQEFLSKYFFFFSLNSSENFSREVSAIPSGVTFGIFPEALPRFSSRHILSKLCTRYPGSFTICQLECRKNLNDDAAGIVRRVSSGISKGISHS